MVIIKNIAWVYYVVNKEVAFDPNKVGKWMYFFDNVELAVKLCSMAVENNIVAEAKHSNAPKGVCCFYLHYDDINAHKKVISFFLENNMIRRTKAGKLYNISFKLDTQTKAGEYGTKFKSNITLSNFLNLATGEFL